MIIIVAGELIIYVSANIPFLQVLHEKENKKIPAEAGIFSIRYSFSPSSQIRP